MIFVDIRSDTISIATDVPIDNQSIPGWYPLFPLDILSGDDDLHLNDAFLLFGEGGVLPVGVEPFSGKNPSLPPPLSLWRRAPWWHNKLEKCQITLPCNMIRWHGKAIWHFSNELPLCNNACHATRRCIEVGMSLLRWCAPRHSGEARRRRPSPTNLPLLGLGTPSYFHISLHQHRLCWSPFTLDGEL